MVKLYFKKLFSMIIGLILWVLIYFVGYNLLATLSNVFENPIIKYLVLFGLPLLAIIIIVYNRRLENNEIRRSYKQAVESSKPTLKETIKYMSNFSDFRAELLSFATIFFPFVLIIGFGAEIPWWASIITVIVVWGVTVAICGIIDFILWTVVHNKWRKDI